MNNPALINIYSEATPNPETMKFVANIMILANDSTDFPNKEAAQDASPLAQKLFEFSFVNGVFIMNNFVTITKAPGYEWFDIIPILREFVKSYLESGEEIVYKRRAYPGRRNGSGNQNPPVTGQPCEACRRDGRWGD